MLCSAALSIKSFQEPIIDITVKWFKNESEIGTRRVWPQTLEIEMENFVLYETSLTLDATLRTETVSYWCQITTISDTTVTFQPSTVTTITRPENYLHLPRCVGGQPLGLPRAECAINGITLYPPPSPPETPSNCKCSTTEAQSSTASLAAASACNETDPHSSESSNSAAVVAPVVILVLLLLVVAIALVSALVGVIYKHRMMEKRRLKGKHII